MKRLAVLLMLLMVAGIFGVALLPPSSATTPSVGSTAPLGAAPSGLKPFFPNVKITDGSSPYKWQVEPTMVINRSGTVFVGWKETSSAEAAGIRVGSSYSTDGGWTWASNILMNQSHPNQGCHNSDPWMALAPDDRVQYAYLEYDCGSFFDITNTTNGHDWGTVHHVQGNGGLVDKDSTGVAPNGRIYASWDEGNVLAVTWSDDGGATWRKPFINPDDTQGSSILGTVIETASNGTVYLVWWNFARSNIYFDWSSDGVTWHTDKRVNDRDGSAAGSGWQISIPAMNVDQGSGAIYVSWPDTRNGNLDIYTSASKDGGVTWSANKRINDDSGSTIQYMVDLAIDGKGTVHAAWEDKRNGAWNIFYSNSTDGGATWAPNLRVSTADTPGSYNRPGDYFALEAGPNDVIYVVWTDGRGDDFDIYFARNPGQPSASVTVDTNPEGLQVTVDGKTTASPVQVDWVINSTHHIAVPSPQAAGTSTRYNWTAWSDGGAISHEIVAIGDMTVTATFVKQYQASLATSPKGLTFTVDNVSYITAASLWWDEGSTHWVDAPSPQTTSASQRYVWSSWNDGSPKAHAVAAAPYQAVANFQEQQTLRVDTNPEGLSFALDGTTYAAPQTLWLPTKSAHFISVDSLQEGPSGVRHRFQAWSDGGDAGHAFTFTGTMALTATFGTEYHLEVDSPVAGQGGSDWYPAGSTAYATVPGLIVDVGPGDRLVFQGWTGDASGSGTISDPILMDGPKKAVADYGEEYFLTVESDYAATSGSGWYAAGSVVHATVSAPTVALGPGIREAFASWSGDASGSGLTSGGVTMDRPRVASASWIEQYFLTVLTPYGSAMTEGWYNAGATVVAGLDTSVVSLGPGKRASFTGWSLDASGTNPAASAPMVMQRPRTALALWRIEYELKVETTYGTASGAGWYPAGSLAFASLNTNTVATGSAQQAVFTQWGGDASGSNAASSSPILMNGPKTATAIWEQRAVSPPGEAPFLTSNNAAIIVLVASVIAALALLRWRIRR